MYSTVLESSRLELQNATTFIEKYSFALDLSEPKSYKPKTVLNWWKTSSKTPTANFWNSKSFKNFTILLKLFHIFSKSFRLPNRFSKWIPYRMPMHSTVLESSRLELQNATTFIKKYSFALDLSEPKSYKPKTVLNWWKTSSKTPTANFLNSKSFKKITILLKLFHIFSKSFRLPNRFSKWIPYRMPMHSTVLESSRLELQNATTFIKKYSFALDLSEPKSYKPKTVLNWWKTNSKSFKTFTILLTLFHIFSKSFRLPNRFSKWIPYRMPMHSTVLESSRLELQNATNFIKKYLFALDLSEPKFYKPKNVLNWWKTSSKTPTANFWNSKSFKKLRGIQC